MMVVLRRAHCLHHVMRSFICQFTAFFNLSCRLWVYMGQITTTIMTTGPCDQCKHYCLGWSYHHILAL